MDSNNFWVRAARYLQISIGNVIFINSDGDLVFVKIPKIIVIIPRIGVDWGSRGGVVS